MSTREVFLLGFQEWDALAEAQDRLSVHEGSPGGAHAHRARSYRQAALCNLFAAFDGVQRCSCCCIPFQDGWPPPVRFRDHAFDERAQRIWNKLLQEV